MHNDHIQTSSLILPTKWYFYLLYLRLMEVNLYLLSTCRSRHIYL